ncbi:MAG: flagellar biosynthetic protein FliO [Oscillospiraceae bacterium]|nr:flagellar biosynthetic protein FliO [Oscillospiraceae bacterium]
MREIISVFIALAAVLGLIVLTLWLTKKLMRKFNFGGGGNGIEIISVCGIGQDKTLVAVRAGNRKLLLGVTPNGINVLSELSDEDISAMTADNSSGMPKKSFAELLVENTAKVLKKEDPFTDVTDNKKDGKL